MGRDIKRGQPGNPGQFAKDTRGLRNPPRPPRTRKEQQWRQDNTGASETHYIAQYGIYADGLDEQGEPAPQDVYSHLNTDPHGPSAVITHTRWTDGKHTVTARWLDDTGIERFAVIAETDDTPDVDGAIAAWRANRI